MSDTRLFLVDGSGYIFRAYHALPQLTRPSDGLPVGAVSGFCNMLYKFLRDVKGPDAPTHLAVIFDKSEHTFRNELYPEYKAHRPSTPEDLVPQFPLIRDAVRAFNIACIEMDGFEADDLIATYARQAARTGAQVRVISSDKDLMQLIEDGVIELYDPMKDKPLRADAVMEKFGVAPNKVIDVQALIGDTTDNVPGAPGIGPKTAAELIGLFGDLDGIIARAGEIKQPKRREAITANVERILMSRTLVTLRNDVAVAEAWESFAVREPDEPTLLQFLDRMEFRTLARRVREVGAKETSAAPSVAVAPAEAEAPPFDPALIAVVTTRAALDAWVARAGSAGALALKAFTSDASSLRADLVGLALALGPNAACYIPLAHRRSGEGDLLGGGEAIDQLSAGEVVGALKPLLEDCATLKVGHDLKYDISVLARLGVGLAPIDDVMLMSYALDAGLPVGHGLDELSERHSGHTPTSFVDIAGKGKAQLSFDLIEVAAAARYAGEQTDAALRLHQALRARLARQRLRTVYETLERPMPAVLAPMERAGIRVDPQHLSRLSSDFAQRMLAFEDEAKKLAGREFNIGSPKQLGEILFDEMKLTGASKTKTGAWSTDESVLSALADQGHELPRVVLDWRQLSKLRSTYTEALREAINPGTRRVHTSFALAATTTGRLSSNDPNLQNIPIRTEEGRRIREAFVAEKGNVLISADYSQIELRLLAHVADIPQLKQAFADGVDIHALTASEMFGVPVAGMDPSVRRQAKAINFGIIYGISAFGLARNLGIERSEADAYIKTYFERFPGIRDYMEAMKAYARANGYVKTIFGRRVNIAGIRAKNPADRSFAERQAINAPLQGAGADIIRRAMIRLPAALAREAPRAQMLLQVHDELLFEAPTDDAATVSAVAKRVMEGACAPALELKVPLTVEARAGASWAAAH
jgi:DNA polymerase-1